MESVLIVDDAMAMRDRLRDIFEELGYNVIAEAGTGKEAYREYKSHQPDLVTMDITMPDMDGIEAVKKIINEFPEANIVMVSALAHRRMLLKALEEGVNHYIVKPVSVKKLKKTLEEVKEIIGE